MMPYKYCSQAKSILCLNGDLPERDFFLQNKVIIATDGAADKLIAIAVNPDIIIGDLDSIKHQHYQNAEIIPMLEQSHSDFQKALKYLEKNNLTPTIVCGVSGGFLDHILYNINIILENACIFYVPPLIGYPIKAGAKLELDLTIDTKISLFAMAKAKVSTTGLRWELTDAILEFPGFNSPFNRTITENISVEALEGQLLVLIYLEAMEDRGSVNELIADLNLSMPPRLGKLP